MTIRVRQNAPQTLQFTATAEGHELPLAMPQPQGEGPDPHDYFDTALGGCKALTLMVYAQRKGCRWNRWAWTWCAMPARNARGLPPDRQADAAWRIDGCPDRRTAGGGGKCPIHKLMTAVDVQVSTLVVRPE